MPQTTAISDEAAVAAKWWADHLRNPEDVEHDAGDLMANAMTSWARDQDSRNDAFDPELVDAFEERLAELIQDRIDDAPWDAERPTFGPVHMKCDYHADPLLQQAAEDVGLEISSMTTFPVKTDLILQPGEVRVRAGYHGDIETIWERGEHLADLREHIDWAWAVEDDEGRTRETEPRIHPAADGYLVRAYGAYSAEVYGPVSRDFHLADETIERDGLEAAVDALEEQVEAWRAETGV